jgi:perosamine synthetase
MSDAFIPVNTPLLDGNEEKYVLECLRTGWISSEGPFVERFEHEFSVRVNRQFGVACSSGSAALDLAVTAAGIGPGDEVIMPTFTIISPAASVVRAGGRPVLVDSEPVTWNMDVTQIEAKITPRTKAILVVHIYGFPADMDPIIDIANRHGLMIIEDAAEMHGQSYRGKPCGSFGLVSTFSFYPNKHITTGEGGMVVTDDPAIAERCRSLRNLCFQPNRRFVHEELGWNYRMTNLQAALGVAQLEKLDEHVKRKREIGRLYDSLFADCDLFDRLPAKMDYADNIHWVYGLVSRENPHDATWWMKELGRQGIGTRPFFWPMHWQPVFCEGVLGAKPLMPIAERLTTYGFYLPSGLGLPNQDLQRVAQAVLGLLAGDV